MLWAVARVSLKGSLGKDFSRKHLSILHYTSNCALLKAPESFAITSLNLRLEFCHPCEGKRLEQFQGRCCKSCLGREPTHVLTLKFL